MNPEYPHFPAPEPEPSEQIPKKIDRRGLLKIGLGLVAGAVAGKKLASVDTENPGNSRFSCAETARKDQSMGIPEDDVSYYDLTHPPEADFFINHPRGELSLEERVERSLTLADGVKVIIDIGLVFYVVQSGDTIDGIRRKCSAIPGFAYLRDQTEKIESFNIPPRSLKPGMLIPIPLENEKRAISDEDFADHARQALLHICEHERYGTFMRQLRADYSDSEIIATMVAFAKQESGGAPIGQFEMHRWEPKHRAFSFSLFHILMVGPGLKARRNLQRTEGQLYHPQNGAELFFSYIIEKLIERHGLSVSGQQKVKTGTSDFFQLNEQTASFYNGKAWKTRNPNYLTNVQRYKERAMLMLKNGKD